MRILIAVDGSESSDAAVAELAQRPLPEGSEIEVVSAYESPYAMLAEPWLAVEVDYEMIEKAERERARRIVEEAATKLHNGPESHKHKVTTKVLKGVPKRAILDEAEAFKADLIILGSHGRGRLERFLLGSVSQAVATHAPCSVEIVRKPEYKTAQR
ncbi:universal stress protein [Pyrinomonas methylaliphatogenes]|jgi:nucleotide-binding universal stress UspA family protein|uniref:Universal stress protein UspA-like protein n=1 Tax=Pyrinomonas methylaliphatogenes TaxID=454194 RepID=A0A0B6WY09_9BACT|nr:universal stress protein [Pyrinomonas methylaliphatogenes]CDM66006.1 universal stress protein UspA-like protein [Pyrinomonas methylaliphatogenes]